MKTRKPAVRTRRILLAVFILLILTGTAMITGALGGLEYGMPLLKGVK